MILRLSNIGEKGFKWEGGMMPKEDPLAFDYESYLTDLIINVEQSKSLNDGKENKRKITFFFPEFEEAVSKSIRNGTIRNGSIDKKNCIEISRVFISKNLGKTIWVTFLILNKFWKQKMEQII
jgi:hypothetical protein